MGQISESSFGEILANLRHELSQFEGYKITQADLASALNERYKLKISQRTIARLEQDKKLGFHKDRYLIECLADYFNLTDTSKQIFYFYAGLSHQPSKSAESIDELALEKSLRDLLTDMSYPFHVITPLWDIIAFNNYIYHLYNYNDKRISLLKSKQGFHNNLLARLFNPDYSSKEYFGSDDNRKTQLTRNLRAFRVLSFPYQASSEYQKLIHFMRGTYKKDFDDLWQDSHTPDIRHKDKGYELPVEPSTLIRTSAGLMKFWTLRFPQEYVGDQVIILGHLPADETSEVNFLKFKKSISKSLHYFGMPDYSLTTSKKQR